MADSLYVHIPFCSHICYYCDFARQRYSDRIADEYLKRLERETDRIQQERFETVYIGGGTPSSLSCQQLEKLFSILERFEITKEFTFEINPESFDLDKAGILKKHGVNRVSIGLQSFDEEILKEAGRVHKREDIDRTFTALQEAGIENRSIDLMYGFHSQTLEKLESDIEKAVKLDVTHISIYELEVHENTVLGKKGYKGCDEETGYLMYQMIMKKLPEYGFVQYEISNFARRGYQSQHNRTYWHYDDYIGVGLSAAGKENHVRYENTSSMKKYLASQFTGEVIPLSEEDERFEAVMMGLRLLEGIDLEKYRQKYGCDLLEHYRDAADRHLKNGNLLLEKGYLKMSQQGIYVMNDILVDFMNSL